GARDRARELLVAADVGDDGDDLPGLDVGAEPHEQLGEPRDPVLGHGRRSYWRRERGAVSTDDAIERLLSSPTLSQATCRAYRSDLRHFAAWLDRRGTDLSE